MEKPIEQTGRRAHAQALRMLLAAAFTTPAALTVLSKIDKRLDFKGIVERVLTNFQIVVDKFWNSVSAFFDVDLTSYADKLTFYSLTVIPILVAKFLTSSEKTEKSRSRQIYETYLRIFGWIGLLYIIYIFNPLSGIGVMVVYLLTWPDKKTVDKYISESKNTYRSLYNNFGLKSLGGVIFNIFWIAIFSYVFYIALLLPLITSPINSAAAILAFAVYIIAHKHCLQHFGYMTLWVLGVLCIHWTATQAIPTINKFLDSAGA